jgi:hypothetical protein
LACKRTAGCSGKRQAVAGKATPGGGVTEEARNQAPGHETQWDKHENEAKDLGNLPRDLERQAKRQRRRSGWAVLR